MTGRLGSLVVVVAALASYHIAQRSMPDEARPVPLFAFVYGAAAVVMVVAMAFGGSPIGVRAISTSATHWAPWLLVASVTGIELGVFAMYRAGWSVGSASVSTQAIAAALLVVVGIVHFGEHLTATRSAGLALCVVGAAMVAAR